MTTDAALAMAIAILAAQFNRAWQVGDLAQQERITAATEQLENLRKSQTPWSIGEWAVLTGAKRRVAIGTHNRVHSQSNACRMAHTGSTGMGPDWPAYTTIYSKLCALLSATTTTRETPMENTIKVITNNVPRDVVNAWELTPAERAEFDHLDWAAIEAGHDSRSFVRYRGELHDLNDFEGRAPESIPGRWDSFKSDSFFSGMVIRYCNDFESVVVGTYIA
jgi:hypothetical protein